MAIVVTISVVVEELLQFSFQRCPRAEHERAALRARCRSIDFPYSRVERGMLIFVAIRWRKHEGRLVARIRALFTVRIGELFGESRIGHACTAALPVFLRLSRCRRRSSIQFVRFRWQAPSPFPLYIFHVRIFAEEIIQSLNRCLDILRNIFRFLEKSFFLVEQNFDSCFFCRSLARIVWGRYCFRMFDIHGEIAMRVFLLLSVGKD